MNLLVLTGYWPTRDNPISGIFVVQQLEALIRTGVTLTVIIPVTIGRYKPLLTLKELNLCSTRIRIIKMPVLRLPEILSSLPGAIRLNTMIFGIMTEIFIRGQRKIQDFDGCIVHGIRYVGLSIPFWRRHILGRIAIVVHGVDTFMIDIRNQIVVRKLCISADAACDSVMLVGQSLRNHSIALGFSSLKIKVIPNGTNLPPRHEINFTQRSSNKIRKVLSVSNLIPLKGLDDNLRALAIISKEHPNLKWEYRIVGDGPYKSVLQELASQLKIGNNVLFLGRLAYDETMQEMSNCDIFSLPSWGEAFGIVYLEAMARGRPVVGCLNNGAADIINHDFDGVLVEPKSYHLLANVLVRLLSNPQECAILGNNARTTAERFTWDVNAYRICHSLNENICDCFPVINK